LQAGLTQRQVAAACGVSHALISRIELGLAPRVPFETLVVIASVLGLDLPLRAFPSGDPIRDAAQLALLGKLRVRLGQGLGWRTEVPIQVAGDRRAWDAVVTGDGWQIPVEAESRLRDVQACLRRTSLKRRDDGQEAVILLVANTRHNRRVLRLVAPDVVAVFPVRSREAIQALASGSRPSGSAIVLL
jgi:transcriptional regulator with XRE-family HTH domain